MLLLKERMLSSNERILVLNEIYSDSKLEVVRNLNKNLKNRVFSLKNGRSRLFELVVFGFLTRKMGVINPWFKNVAALIHFPYQSIRLFKPMYSHQENHFIKGISLRCLNFVVFIIIQRTPNHNFCRQNIKYSNIII
jgi:hypothetical protein